MLAFLLLLIVFTSFYIAVHEIDEKITKHRREKYAKNHFSETERFRRGIR